MCHCGQPAVFIRVETKEEFCADHVGIAVREARFDARKKEKK